MLAKVLLIALGVTTATAKVYGPDPTGIDAGDFDCRAGYAVVEACDQENTWDDPDYDYVARCQTLKVCLDGRCTPLSGKVTNAIGQFRAPEGVQCGLFYKQFPTCNSKPALVVGHEGVNNLYDIRGAPTSDNRGIVGHDLGTVECWRI